MSAAMMHTDVEAASGEYSNEYPLVCEATAAIGKDQRPAYQACRTGTRFWRAQAARSVGGEWRIYVWVHGPRGTEYG